MEKKLLFSTFKEWLTFLWGSVRKCVKGFAQILYALLMGVVSLLVFCVKQIEAFCKRETIAAFIIALVILGMGVGWISTFTHERQATVVAQHRADSISYSLERYLQVYDSSATVVVNGDTVKYGK